MQERQYDVVIIGAGLGGLLCAVMLAKEGKKVCVLEKNRQIGGCLQTFAFQKKVFDACVHYIGGLGEGHTLHQIFSYAGIVDALPLQALDSRGFDHIAFGGESETFPIATREHFIENLLPHFPAEEMAMRQYLSLIEAVTAHFPLYNLKHASASAKDAVTDMELMSTLRKLTTNERLIKVLAGNNLLYAGVEGQTPFYVHAMSVDGYLHSAHKAIPGSSAIARLLWRELQRHGGEIHRHAQVVSLREAGGVLQWAETADGQRWMGAQFIAAVHPSVLFALTGHHTFRPAFRERVGALPHTPPGIMINLVLKPAAIPYEPRNIYWHPSGEVVGKPTMHGIQWPDTQALFFNEDRSNPGFAESVTILAYADAAQFARWAESENITGTNGRRNDAYTAQKDAVADTLLEKTFLRFPELKDAIVGRSIATPLSFRDYTGTPGGSLYGPLKDVRHPGFAMLPVRTRIPNLFLTGQNVNMHGVMGVSMTAIATCGQLLGTDYLLERIRNA